MWQAVCLCGAHGITCTVPTFCFCVGCHMGACPLGKDLLEFSCRVLKCPLGLCVLDPPCDWVGLLHQKSPGQNHKGAAITAGTGLVLSQRLRGGASGESAWAPICLPASWLPNPSEDEATG